MIKFSEYLEAATNKEVSNFAQRKDLKIFLEKLKLEIFLL